MASSPTPIRQRHRAKSEDWEDEVAEDLAASEKGHIKRPSTPKRTPIRARTTPRTLASPARSTKTNRPVKTYTAIASPPASTSPTPRATAKAQPISPWFGTIIGTTFKIVLALIQLTHTILSPIYPYLFLTIASLLLLSGAIYYLPSAISSILYKFAGKALQPLLRTPNLTIGQDALQLPIRTLSTPLCALTGQLCGLSLLANETAAQPFWRWNIRQGGNQVDVGRVAREMAREVQGAKDIFDSLALLTSGGMVDRSEHVRIWELGVAVQIGSSLEEKEVVTEQLVHLGNMARDLSEALIETNAMAVDSFTWLEWEFRALVKALQAPSATRTSNEKLAARLNAILNRLTESLDKLHASASNAFVLAQKGSVTGQTLRTRLNPIVEELRDQHQRSPGWRLAVDKSKHFITGGEISKAERISRDLSITEDTIGSLSTLVRGLEESRLGIKTFVSQIGFFQASMVGFHLGAGEHVGIGPEEEIETLAQVVAELGRSVGRAKHPVLEAEVPAIDA